MLRSGGAKQKPSILAPKALGAKTSNASGEEYTPAALSTYRNEFGDALQAALVSFETHEKISTTSTTGDGKKAKKKKGKILFAL